MSIDVTNPFTLKHIETLGFTSEKEIEVTLATMFQDWKRKNILPKSERIQILENLSRAIKANISAIATLATNEGGKALKDSIIEVERAASGVDYAIHILKTSHGEMVPMGLNAASQHKLAFSLEEPIGPILAISAFNHPFNLIVHQVVPAVAVGAPILIRPASTTPLSCRLLLSMLYEAGLPQDKAKMILCSRETAEKLAEDKRFRFFSFVGSAKVGWHLKKKLQPYVYCSMEHGGVAPAIVWNDVDIDEIIPGLVKAGYYHAGQVCVSLQKLIIHQDIYKTFRDKFLKEVEKVKVGDPLLESSDYGPMISSEEKERALEWVAEVKDQIILGGRETLSTCMEPTIIEEPDHAALVSQKEVFAPLVCLYSFNTKEQALAIANTKDVSFQSSIYTKNIDLGLSFARDLDCVTALLNESPAFRVDWMPFGGRHHSGYGVGGIPYAMRDYTHSKRLVVQSKEITK